MEPIRISQRGEVKVKQSAPKRQTLTCRVEDIPKEGFLRRREMEALFNRHIDTLKRWAKKGLIPKPINDRPDLAEILGPTVDKFWDAQEVWKAFDKMRGAETLNLSGKHHSIL